VILTKANIRYRRGTEEGRASFALLGLLLLIGLYRFCFVLLLVSFFWSSMEMLRAEGVWNKEKKRGRC
jgi:uncharacterized membrane protein